MSKRVDITEVWVRVYVAELARSGDWSSALAAATEAIDRYADLLVKMDELEGSE